MKDFDNYYDQDVRVRTLMDTGKYVVFYQVLSSLVNIEGQFGELGVYKGGSARFFARIAEDFGKEVYLFDTFNGIESGMLGDNDVAVQGPNMREGEFKHELSNVEVVKEFLSDLPVHIFQGRFPQSASDVDEQFVFVHLDADMYASTLAGLEWFYERLVPGGVIVLDDYTLPSCPGVKTALDEFGRPYEKISTYQAIVRT